MPRGRKRIPDEIKRLRGIDKKNPDRLNYAAPKPDRKKHRKPGWVKDKHAVEAWKYYGELLDKLGVLTTTDKMALEQLSQKEIIHLDEERKASMVSNLMVVLCADKDVTPVVNTGTLHQ